MIISLKRFEGIYLHRGFVDMRKNIDGLTYLATADMKLKVYGKYLFVFCNKNRDRLKILYWDQTGFAVWFKRLEKSKFKWPVKLSESDVIELSGEQLKWLLDGIDLTRVRRHDEIKYEKVL